jgi:stalled ribosome rescue protein Dom34
MQTLADRFQDLSAAQKRVVHQFLCEHALAKWREFCESKKHIVYVETVCGTQQAVDMVLPDDALRSARESRDIAEVDRRYSEPIAAMQDDDLSFPKPITFAYYAVYNMFNKYVRNEAVDDWLIVNQALSAETDESRWQSLLEAAIERAR